MKKAIEILNFINYKAKFFCLVLFCALLIFDTFYIFVYNKKSFLWLRLRRLLILE